MSSILPSNLLLFLFLQGKYRPRQRICEKIEVWRGLPNEYCHGTDFNYFDDCWLSGRQVTDKTIEELFHKLKTISSGANDIFGV
jgi:hypothetical protein